MQRTPVQSSNIRSVGWNEGTLEIEFASGGVYQYVDVPAELALEFLLSNSKGQFFHARIKNAFAFTKLDVAA